MWSYMDQTSGIWSSSNQEGVERVLKEDGQYAFMMESTVVDYVVERQCELTQVGGLLDNKGYGIGLPPSKIWTHRGKLPTSSSLSFVNFIFIVQFKSSLCFEFINNYQLENSRENPLALIKISSPTDLRFTEICVWWTYFIPHDKVQK